MPKCLSNFLASMKAEACGVILTQLERIVAQSSCIGLGKDPAAEKQQAIVPLPSPWPRVSAIEPCTYCCCSDKCQEVILVVRGSTTKEDWATDLLGAGGLLQQGFRQ